MHSAEVKAATCHFINCLLFAKCKRQQLINLIPVDWYSLIAKLMGQHGAHLGPVGPRWALCWPMNFALRVLNAFSMQEQRPDGTKPLPESNFTKKCSWPQSVVCNMCSGSKLLKLLPHHPRVINSNTQVSHTQSSSYQYFLYPYLQTYFIGTVSCNCPNASNPQNLGNGSNR